VADTQNAVNARLEVHRNPVNDESLLTLKDGERTTKLTYDDRTYEQRLQEDTKRDEVPEVGIEKRLDDASEAHLGHHGETEESVAQSFAKREKTPEPQKRQSANKVDKIDPKKDDTLGKQIADSHGKELGDETIEQMLLDEWGGLTDEEADEAKEILLRQIEYTGKSKRDK
jgi:hypothetical protein